MSTDMTLPGADVPIIDETRLINEFGNDPEILAELRDLFLEHAPPLFSAMTEAIQTGDCDSLVRDAHSFKGACATYGAARLAMVCREFEMAAKQNDMASIQANTEHLDKEYHAVFEAVGSIGVG